MGGQKKARRRREEWRSYSRRRSLVTWGKLTARWWVRAVRGLVLEQPGRTLVLRLVAGDGVVQAVADSAWCAGRAGGWLGLGGSGAAQGPP